RLDPGPGHRPVRPGVPQRPGVHQRLTPPANRPLLPATPDQARLVGRFCPGDRAPWPLRELARREQGEGEGSESSAVSQRSSENLAEGMAACGGRAPDGCRIALRHGPVDRAWLESRLSPVVGPPNRRKPGLQRPDTRNRTVYEVRGGGV